MDVCSLHRGTLPILVSLPHDGSNIPEELAARMTATARRAPDTDWFVGRLYGFAVAMGASVLVPTHSRYVVDLNRPRDDVSLYPGQNTTGLCPIVQFTGEPVYLAGGEPTPAEIVERVDRYWRPYHDALQSELARIRAAHDRVLLWEGHSIRSRVPFLFEGRLPDFNLGTASGNSCLPTTQAKIESILADQQDFSWVANGRFKGGHITRHYGRPHESIEAVQLELAQEIYMDEGAVEYLPERADKVAALIERCFDAWLAQ